MARVTANPGERDQGYEPANEGGEDPEQSRDNLQPHLSKRQPSRSQAFWTLASALPLRPENFNEPQQLKLAALGIQISAPVTPKNQPRDLILTVKTLALI